MATIRTMDRKTIPQFCKRLCQGGQRKNDRPKHVSLNHGQTLQNCLLVISTTIPNLKPSSRFKGRPSQPPKRIAVVSLINNDTQPAAVDHPQTYSTLSPTPSHSRRRKPPVQPLSPPVPHPFNRGLPPTANGPRCLPKQQKSSSRPPKPQNPTPIVRTYSKAVN